MFLIKLFYMPTLIPILLGSSQATSIQNRFTAVQI